MSLLGRRLSALFFVTAILPTCNSLAQLPATEIEIINVMSTGYFSVMVDGAPVRYAIKAEKQRRNVIWNAGPGASITVRTSNFTVDTKTMSVVVKVYSDEGKFVGIVGPRNFEISNEGARTFTWEIRDEDVKR